MKIAICGKMCSGKSTLANHIMRTFPGYQKYSLAKRVKELCVELFDMKGKDRELLITFANSMRDIDPNVWIKQVLKETKDKEKNPSNSAESCSCHVSCTNCASLERKRF